MLGKNLKEKDIQLAQSISMAPKKLDKYIILLKNDYGYSLSKSNLAKVLGKSEQTIDRQIKQAINIPNYIRSSEGKKSSFIFPIIEVATYLTKNTIKNINGEEHE